MNILDDSDCIIIKDMAKKYKMGVKSFGKVVSTIDEIKIVKQVRFSKEEMEVIKNKLLKYGIKNKSKLTMKLIEHYLKNNNIKTQVFYKSFTCEKRDIRFCINFNNNSLYNKIIKYCDKENIEFSEFIRYVVLNYDI